MPKLTRYLQKIFANNSNQVGVFGTGVDKETSKNVETLQSADYENGWSSAIITNKNYPIWQEMDGVQYGLSYQIKYLQQAGIPEWLSTETYYTNSYCRYGSDIYYSLQDDNTNHNPALNDGWWTPLLTSSRSIGEIATSTIPLTEAGLHLLDGALISNGIYADFVDYVSDLYNDTKVYNPSAFTVVGSPTITSDGIASGFSSSNLISCSVNTGNTFTLKQKIKAGSDISGAQIFAYAYRATSTSDRLFDLRFNNGNFFIVYKNNTGTNTTQTLSKQVSANTEYVIELVINNGSIKWYIDGDLVYTSDDLYVDGISKIETAPSSSAAYFKGSIDFKEFSISAGGIQVLSGSNSAGFCLESEWQQSVTNYGVCGKFVYEPSSNTVRLPKITGILEGTTDVTALGDLVEAGLPNITGGINGFFCGGPSENSAYGAFGNVGSWTTGAGSNGSGPCFDFAASRSSTIYGNSNTVQPQTIKILYYIVVATSTKTDIQVDIDEIATDLNGKADTDLSNVSSSKGILTESYVNGTSWYRVYSDGWCEQGGTLQANVSFLKEFSNTDYTISLAQSGSGASSTVGRSTWLVKSTSGFTAILSTPTDWRACGYIN